MLICRYCQTTVCDSTTKTCPKCGTVNALRFIPIGGEVRMKPEKDVVVSEDDLDHMMHIDPNADPYGSQGSVGFLEGAMNQVIGYGSDFHRLADGVECRQVAGARSYITGIGWKNDLDLGMALLMEAQDG